MRKKPFAERMKIVLTAVQKERADLNIRNSIRFSKLSDRLSNRYFYCRQALANARTLPDGAFEIDCTKWQGIVIEVALDERLR